MMVVSVSSLSFVYKVARWRLAVALGGSVRWRRSLVRRDAAALHLRQLRRLPTHSGLARVPGATRSSARPLCVSSSVRVRLSQLSPSLRSSPPRRRTALQPLSSCCRVSTECRVRQSHCSLSVSGDEGWWCQLRNRHPC